MSRRKQMEIEMGHLLRFKESYPEFPNGEIYHGDNPDFSIKRTNSLLGIEHTQVFYDVGSDGINLKEQESLRREIAKAAQAEYIQRNGSFAMVSIAFNSWARLTPAHAKKMPRALVETVFKYPGKEKLGFDEGLPDEISEISVRTYEGISYSRWNDRMFGWVASIGREKIAAAIEDKEPKVERYKQNVQEVWLLIVADGFSPSSNFSYDDIERVGSFKTAFDRVILFEGFGKTCYPIKIEK